MVVPVQAALANLKIDLDKVIHRPPKANYILATWTRSSETTSLIHLAGHIPYADDGSVLKGQIGPKCGLSVQQGYEIARKIGISLLKTLHEQLNGQLERVTRIVKINGLVRAEDSEFDQHPAVIDGASDLMVAVFGAEIGKHARCAYGVHSLPFNAPVEIDMLCEITNK